MSSQSGLYNYKGYTFELVRSQKTMEIAKHLRSWVTYKCKTSKKDQ